jgi:shikimate dehydrogenase
MTFRISKDTALCMSLSARPGNFGTRFHNFLYEELKLDFVYKAFTTRDLKAAIGGIRALGIRGCAVSMPFKEACIELVDELDETASAISSVNTIVNSDGHLKAYNTDYVAISQLLAAHGVAPESTFALRGSGGMAKAVASAMRDAGFRSGHILARNSSTGQALARSCGFEWRAELGGLRPELLINVTPIGMRGGAEAEELAFDADTIESARTVFDVVAVPPETPLLRAARTRGKAVITGAEVIQLQAVEQFVLYTGVRPKQDQIERAAGFALAEPARPAR